MRWLFFLLLCLTLSKSLGANEERMVTLSSSYVHYDGNAIFLEGDVSLENFMGKITADQATLTKDTTKGSIDFPWIELKRNVEAFLTEGSFLKCHQVFIDHTTLKGNFYGSPQLYYKDEKGELFADTAVVNYKKHEGRLEVVKITLQGNVQVVANAQTEKIPLQMALADSVEYLVEEDLMLMKALDHSRVLFFDKEKQMQLSAKEVKAKRKGQDGKEWIQGVGDVRFVFKQEELQKLKERFHWES